MSLALNNWALIVKFRANTVMQFPVYIGLDKSGYQVSYFAIKTNVVGTHYKHLAEVLLTSTHMFLWRNKKNVSFLTEKKNLVNSYDCINTYSQLVFPYLSSLQSPKSQIHVSHRSPL